MLTRRPLTVVGKARKRNSLIYDWRGSRAKTSVVKIVGYIEDEKVLSIALLIVNFKVYAMT